MMLEILIIIYLIVLLRLSLYDYNTLHVKLSEVILACIIGGIYGFLTGDYIRILALELIMIMVFGLPCLFSLGLGDFLIFLSLAPFLIIGDIQLFFLVFFSCWIVWHILMVSQNVIFGELKNFKESFSKKNITTLFYPLVPVIFISFLIWLFLQYIPRF